MVRAVRMVFVGNHLLHHCTGALPRGKEHLHACKMLLPRGRSAMRVYIGLLPCGRDGNEMMQPMCAARQEDGGWMHPASAPRHTAFVSEQRAFAGFQLTAHNEIHVRGSLRLGLWVRPFALVHFVPIVRDTQTRRVWVCVRRGNGNMCPLAAAIRN